MNSSLGHLVATENYYKYNNTNDSYENAGEITPFILGWIAWMGITFLTCCIGLVGNGYIIWLLGFQIKRNCFTTFILNLAVADFGFLTSVVINDIQLMTNFLGSTFLSHFCAFFSYMMFMNSHFLLAAISIDRCIVVLFPIWHHCSRPKHLSTVVCIFLWVSSFLLNGSIMVFIVVFGYYNLFGLHFFLTAIVCIPSITLTTVVLFIKVCFKPKQQHKGQLLLMVLITLLCFLILAFPLNAFVLIVNFSNVQISPFLLHWETGIIICACLNSSINPVIYFLVGRKKGAQSKESMKTLLQNTFNESEATGGR
ncbi:mas-related G-protein coupled receptor member H-like [Thamnophis elegans]|uniref:mas-related G-protein coupled receptor member H-like n=1 Tax=Thamnophis elegans TaxID=35005 RepID=UPI0013781F8B|nr:mas-related G-protein coupled receptor member H-like [Thamnophis elegans]